MAVESVVECAWNGWTNQRGITGRMTVEWVVEWAWNTHYPEVGLTLLTSSDDGAVFEYVPPRDFVMPSDVTLAEP